MGSRQYTYLYQPVKALTGFSITICAVGNHRDMKPSLLLLWQTNNPVGSVIEPS